MLDAQLPPNAPPPIVVIAKALPEPEPERAFDVHRLDARDLKDAPSTQLDEILKQVAGLQLFRRTDARSGHPTSQGVTLRALGGNAASRALLVLDGVPQADPFGGWVNWPAYNPASLGEVRVIRGGGSVGYGPGALAGVIEMSTRLQSGIEADAFIGSRNAQEVRLLAGANLGGGHFSLSTRIARGDGFIPITRETRGPADRAAPYHEANVHGLWTSELAGDVELQIGASAFMDRRERGLAFTANHTDGADASLRLVGRGRWGWSATAYGQWRELMSSFASVDEDRTTATRVSLQDKVPSHAWGGSFELRPPLGRNLELRVGGDARFMTGESRELFSYIAGEPTRRRRSGGETATAGAFAELAGKTGQLSLSGGARLDHWSISDGSLREREIATGRDLRNEIYPDRDGWLPTARAGAVMELHGGYSLRSAVYLGWRMPTLNELFRPFRAGSDATAANPGLDPERLSGIEGGLDYRSSSLDFSLTLFANRLRNAIANVTLGHGPGVFPGVGFVPSGGEFRQRQNLSAIRVRGIEATARYRKGPWSLGASESFVDAEVEADDEAAPLDALRPAQTPRFVLTGAISWERDRRVASLIVRHVGNQFEDDLNQRSLRVATIVDGFAAWPLSRRLQMIFRAENLLNKVVEAGIGGDGAVERGTPRTLWLGFRFSGG